MVKGDVTVLRNKLFRTCLYRLLQNGAHPFDLQFGVESSRNILKYQPQWIVKSCGSKEESKEIKERKFPRYQESTAGQDGGSQPKPEKGLCGANEHAGCQLGMDGTFFHGGQLFLQFSHIRFLAAAGFDVPYGFQTFLDAVGHCPFVQNILRAKGILYLLTSR